MASSKTITGILFFLAIHITAAGQQAPQAIIKGRTVENASKEPMQYVNIALFRTSDSSLVKAATTDLDGQFMLTNVPGGLYYLESSFIGFVTRHTGPLNISNAGATVDLGVINLEVSSLILNAVEVKAEKTIFSNSIDRKVYNVEKDILAQSSNATEILRNIPSVAVDVEGQVSLRGSSNITFFINGRPSTLLRMNSIVALQQIPANTIERIEVITNPSAKYKPDGVGGIINIVLKKNTTRGMNGILMASAGNQGRYNANLSLNYNTGKMNLHGSYGFRHSDTPRLRSDERIRRDSLEETLSFFDYNEREEDRSYAHVFNGGFDYDLNENNRFSFTGSLYVKDSREETNANTIYRDAFREVTSLFTSHITKTEPEVEYELSAVFEHTFDEDHTLSLEANLDNYREKEDVFFTDRYQFPSVSNLFTHNLINKNGPLAEFYAEYARPLGDEGELEAGYVYEFFRDNLDYNFETKYFEEADWTRDFNRSNEFIFTQQIHALYATYGHSFDRFSFLAGLRAEQSLVNSHLVTFDSIVPNDYFKVYPTLHLSYELSDHEQIQLNYSKRIKRADSDEHNPFPEYKDPRNIEAGNPRLKPEQVHSLELGYEAKYDRYSFLTSVYYRYMYDAFTSVDYYVNDTTLLESYINLANEQAAGVELIVSTTLYDIVNLNFNANGYYNVIDATNLGFSAARSNFTWDAKLTSNITLSQNTFVQFNAHYRSARISAQGSRKPLFLFNGGIRQDLFNDRASLTLTASDVFNSLRRESAIDTPTLYQKVITRRRAQVVHLGFIYRFGQAAKKRSEELEFEDSI
jgi:outer membrane receptor protein involved in Fe transport